MTTSPRWGQGWRDDGRFKYAQFKQLLEQSAGKCDWSCCPKPTPPDVEATAAATDEEVRVSMENSSPMEEPSKLRDGPTNSAFEDETTAQSNLVRTRMKNLAAAWNVPFQQVVADFGIITENCSRTIHRLKRWPRQAVLEALPPRKGQSYKPADFKRVCENLDARSARGSSNNPTVLDPSYTSPIGKAYAGSAKRPLHDSPRCLTDGTTKRRRTSPPSLHHSQMVEVFRRLGSLYGIEVVTSDEIPPGPSLGAGSAALIPIRVGSRYMLGHVSGGLACAYFFGFDDIELCHARIRNFYDKRSNGEIVT
ncbi:hypothetical protein HYQ45_018977 [Verticillium longisporum]|uniref:Uncharacterized protein n=1 Tax=Verticillium longisporum TaxID=100787 RepID=A0A8I3AJW5_VERLO|nr:hypothetical protein HYQ45_018977 [Verticillium longisporum]